MATETKANIFFFRKLLYKNFHWQFKCCKSVRFIDSIPLDALLSGVEYGLLVGSGFRLINTETFTSKTGFWTSYIIISGGILKILQIIASWPFG